MKRARLSRVCGAAVVMMTTGVLILASPARAGDQELPVITEAQLLLASDGAAGDRFGAELAREGDVLIVGAPQSAPDGLPGSFYVFTRGADGLWSEQQRVTSQFEPGDGEIGDEFGTSIALAGDVVAVSAPQTASTSVYTMGPGGSWSLHQQLTPESGVLGGAVALIGDDLAVVGADGGESRLSVFTRDGEDQWLQSGQLALGTQPSPYDLIDHDGDTIVVTGRLLSGDDIGAVVVDASSWSVSATIAMPAETVLENVRSVSLDGDGLALGVIDAIGPDRVHLFAREQPGVWTEQAVLDPDGGGDNDLFGGGVALKGDVLLVGAGHGSGSGIVHVFRRDPGGTWTTDLYLKNSDPFFSQDFGDEIDHQEEPIVGMASQHDNGLYAGAVYVFDPIPQDVPGDVSGDGIVDVQDLLAVILAWGPCPAPPDVCPGDLDGSGAVDVADLVTVIGSWTD